MCGVRLSDKKASAELLSRLDIECVSVVVRRGRLRWFGHVERKQPDDWVSACRHIVVESVKGRCRGRPTGLGRHDESVLRRHVNVEA